jgi:hypothetical protein
MKRGLVTVGVRQSRLVSVQTAQLIWHAFIVQLQRLHKLHVVTFQSKSTLGTHQIVRG